MDMVALRPSKMKISMREKVFATLRLCVRFFQMPHAKTQSRKEALDARSLFSVQFIAVVHFFDSMRDRWRSFVVIAW